MDHLISYILGAILLGIALHSIFVRFKVTQAQSAIEKLYHCQGSIVRGFVRQRPGFGPHMGSIWLAFSRSITFYDVFVEGADGRLSWATWSAQYYGVISVLEKVVEWERGRPCQSPGAANLHTDEAEHARAPNP